MPAINYSIRKNRLKRAFMDGIKPLEDYGKLGLTDTPVRRMYLQAIDSTENKSRWGRFSFDAELTEDMAIYVYVAAVDNDTVYEGAKTYKINERLCSDEVSDVDKKALLSEMGVKRYVGKTDLLLYEFEGRYLYLAIEIIGDGEGSLSNLKVDTRGDNFMDTLPEVYRERNGFLHRFLSAFSSIYNDFEGEIDKLPEILDPKKAPTDVLLEYGRWMGIDLSGNFLSDQAIRLLVKEGYNLNRMKGTRACIKRLFEIVLGEEVIILEQNTIRSYPGADEYPWLKVESIYDVNILVKTPLTDTDRHQLIYLLRQFVPVRTRLHLIQVKDSGVLDTDTYLDMNAIITEETYGSFDENMELDDDIIMD